MQLGKSDRTPKGEATALLLDGQRRRTGYPAAAGAGELLIGTASAPAAAGPAGSPDPVPGRDVAMGLRLDGAARRCPADPFPFGAWPVPADEVAMVISAELLIGTASAPPLLQGLLAIPCSC